MIRLDGEGEYEFEIVGERFYQDALAAIAGPKTEDGVEHYCEAVLEHEPRNPYDPNAVAVLIAKRKVGHLPKEFAPRFLDLLERRGHAGSRVAVAAVVTGGWRRNRRGAVDEGFYGVKLDM
ncbi:HIRAN domain-containing protein [Cereibacter sphaeroides]|uniref:HIRAN domain-containing protein n=1 Tax=Cereibacter sphaeroides TaxID=1063 RepID=UPI003FCDDA44